MVGTDVAARGEDAARAERAPARSRPIWALRWVAGHRGHGIELAQAAGHQAIPEHGGVREGVDAEVQRLKLVFRQVSKRRSFFTDHGQKPPVSATCWR